MDCKLGKYYSWTVEDENLIVKKCYKSFFEHKSSGIPIEIRWFFDADTLKKGEKLDVVLNYNGIDYPCYISRKTNDKAASKIIWNKDLSDKLEAFNPIDDSYPNAVFEKVEKNRYILKMQEQGIEKMLSHQEFWNMFNNCFDLNEMFYSNFIKGVAGKNEFYKLTWEESKIHIRINHIISEGKLKVELCLNNQLLYNKLYFLSDKIQENFVEHIQYSEDENSNRQIISIEKNCFKQGDNNYWKRQIYWIQNISIKLKNILNEFESKEIESNNKNITEWFISGNPQKYDVVGALRSLGKVNWRQSTNIEVGDIVYIYLSQNIQSIRFKCKVNKVNLSVPEINDQNFNLSGEFDGSYGRYMEIELLEELDGNLYTKKEMEKHGFLIPQSPIKVKPETKEFLDIVQSLQHAKEMAPDSHDGSYELMRNTIDAYAQMGDLSLCDYNDLNLIYHMSLGTWKHGIDAKINSIRESNLSDLQKERLFKILKRVRNRALKKMYSNNNNDSFSIGMFGTGFFTFKGKTDELSPRNFIQMCVDIMNMEDEDEIFNRCEKTLDSSFRGMKAASASMVLHCLKPTVFPIFNSNMGSENIFVYLGLKMKNITEIHSYIKNCKLVKSFRDKNFTVKNYRIFDIAAWKIGSYQKYKTDKTNFWSCLEKYTPGITTEKWKKLLANDSVTLNSDIQKFKTLLKTSDKIDPHHFTEVDEKVTDPYIDWISSFAYRVHKATDCPLFECDGESIAYAIPFTGKTINKNNKKEFSWKLRDELKEALETMSLTEIKSNQADKITECYKNIILYGPPGTGKTYNSAIHAVAICDGKNVNDYKDYDAVMNRYNELKSEGRIAFTTFHQSYGYEEFIEGIKPLTDDDTKDISYSIESGIFKDFCEKASKEIIQNNMYEISKDPTVWKVTIRDSVKEDCFKNNRVRINWGEKTKGASSFVNDIKKGDIIITTSGSRTYINGVAIAKSSESYNIGSKNDEDRTSRDVKWLATNIDEDIRPINSNKCLHRKTCTRVPYMKISELLSLTINAAKNTSLSDIVVTENKHPYVFIIDEINRGNISKIFGELITLIETTKRQGMPEELSATLPYSGELFSVPSNVYIIGTMNTADRSIALIDTALRRRFQFIEMIPDAQVLRDIGADKVQDLDVAKLLETINERIEFLYDREHTIGHAFFTELKNDPSVEKLRAIFEKSVIPLLQEYFFEDYQKIQMVFGDNDNKKDPALKIIADEDIVANSIFKGSVEDIIDLPPKKYIINKEALDKLDSYKQIM